MVAAAGFANVHAGEFTVQAIVGVPLESLTVPASAIEWETDPETGPPAFTTNGTVCVVTTCAVSLTGGFTPSFAVNVAVNVPGFVQVTVVDGTFGLAKLHAGSLIVHVSVGVLSRSVTEPLNAIPLLTWPETSGPAFTVGGVFAAPTGIVMRAVCGMLQVTFACKLPFRITFVVNDSALSDTEPDAGAIALTLISGVIKVA